MSDSYPQLHITSRRQWRDWLAEHGTSTPGVWVGTWKKPTGKKVPTPGDPGTTMDETAQVIPPQYNTQSKLTADIKSGSNTADFALTSH